MKLKKKKPYINKDAGNVEANVAFFNNAATGGNMMGEDLNQIDIYDLDFNKENKMETENLREGKMKFKDLDEDDNNVREMEEKHYITFNHFDPDYLYFVKSLPDWINNSDWIVEDVTGKYGQYMVEHNDEYINVYKHPESLEEVDKKLYSKIKKYFEENPEDDYYEDDEYTFSIEKEGFEEYNENDFNVYSEWIKDSYVDGDSSSAYELYNFTDDLFTDEPFDDEEDIDESLTENLNNVVEVEEKSKEVVDPGFADGVREIKDNEEKVDELQKVRKAPEQGKETLSDDIKFTLDESLFVEANDGRLIKNISVEIYDDDIVYISEEGTSGSRYNINIDAPHTIVDAFEEYLFDNFNAPIDESIKTRKGIKRIDNLKESEEEYTVKEYLDDVRYFGDGYITVDKIEFDIDQGGYKFKTSDVLNAATKAGWQFIDDPDDGLLISFNKHIIKEENKR